MTGLPCVVCGGTKQYLGSTPDRPVSAPPILLPCPKCKNAHVGPVDMGSNPICPATSRPCSVPCQSPLTGDGEGAQ